MKNENIKVSLILPVYNVGKYLEECLNSVINQTHSNIEIILVNDGSSDNSQEICEKFVRKDKRIKLINQKNSGVSKARNVGILHATGEYICFADSDDYLKENYVEYLLDLAIKNNADISLTQEMMTTFHPNEIENNSVKVCTPEEALIEILCYNVPIGVYCKLFKKKIIEQVKFEEDLFIGEGFNFNTDAFQRANRVAMGKKRIYFYRRDNESSATTKFSMKKWDNGLYAIEKIYKKLIFKGDRVIKAWKYAWWHTNCDVLNLLIMSNSKNVYNSKYKECKKIAKRNAYYSFTLPIRFREKVRAIIIMINPKIIAYMLKRRNQKYIK